LLKCIAENLFKVELDFPMHYNKNVIKHFILRKFLLKCIAENLFKVELDFPMHYNKNVIKHLTNLVFQYAGSFVNL